MRRDEFNSVKVKNEINAKAASSFEFFKTQKEEFSFHNDNPHRKNGDYNKTKTDNDVNAKHVTGDKKKNIDIKSSTNAASETGSVAASTSATSSVVASVSAVAAAALTVTVISVGTGVSILPDTSVKAEFIYSEVMPNAFEYEVRLDNGKELTYEEIEEIHHSHDKEMEADYLLYVINDFYNDYRELFLYQENYGYFEGLTSGQKYNLLIKENKPNGQNIYEGVFTTPIEEEPEKHSEVFGILIGEEIDFRNYVFPVRLEYEDNEDRFNNFALRIFGENIEYTFELEKTPQEQMINFNPEIIGQQFDFENNIYQYQLTYFDGNEPVNSFEGQINFTSQSEMISEIYGLYISDIIDYQNNFLTVRIEYVDDYNIYNYFSIRFVDDENNEYYLSLEKTPEEQQVMFNPEELDLYNKPYTYYLIYSENGKENQGFEGFIDFSSQSQVVFYNFDISNVNTMDGYIEYYLSFEDMKNQIDSFVLSIYDLDYELISSLELDNQIGENSVYYDTDLIDFNHNVYRYILYYYINEEVYQCSSGTIDYTSEDITEFYSFKITNVDKENAYIIYELLFDDINNHFSDFTLAICDYYSGNELCVFEFEHESGEGVVQYDSSLLDFNYQVYSYRFTYKYDGVDAEEITGELDYMIKMTPSQASFESFEILDVDTENGYIYYSLSFYDPNEELSNFILTIYDSAAEQGYSIDIPYVGGENYVAYDNQTIDFEHNVYSYTFTYNQNEESFIAVEGELNYVKDENVPVFNSFEITSVDTQNGFIYYILSYEDENDQITNFILTINDDTSGEQVFIQLIAQNGQSSVTYDTSMLDFDNNEYSYVLSYYINQEEYQCSSGVINFVTEP